MNEPPSQDVLTADEALSYWQRRHAKVGPLRSGGHIGLDEVANHYFYMLRLGLLLPLLGDRPDQAIPTRVLDAGCGKGWFTRALKACGFLVDGVDASPAAIDECMAEDPGGTYTAATLAAFGCSRPYDAVVSVDVLFHITDDAQWVSSLRSLAGCVRLAGRLIVADVPLDERWVLGDYIVHRPVVEYLDILAPHGFTYAGHVPYGYRDNRIGYHTFTRMG